LTPSKHAMVLGATGFIGRRLSVHLASTGWRVDRVVRRSHASGDDLVESHGPTRTIRIGPSGDWIGRALALSEPSVVFNLAAAGVGMQIPYSHLVDGNAGIVARILENLNPRRTTTVVHAGSWSQYLQENPTDAIEETVRMEPPTVYGAAKVGAELVGRAISREIGIHFVTLRLFNVYGPGEGPSRLIPYVTEAVSTGAVADLTSGEQIRDFVHVDDVVNAFEACAVRTQPAAASFNVATGVPTRVRDVAAMAAAAAGGDLTLLRFGAKPPRANEPLRVVGDASALTQATGWKPQIPVAKGVHDTVRGILEGRANRD